MFPWCWPNWHPLPNEIGKGFFAYYLSLNRYLTKPNNCHHTKPTVIVTNESAPPRLDHQAGNIDFIIEALRKEDTLLASSKMLPLADGR
ncbi:hypothetical protein B4901_09445 [Yersinia frederiksenii]|nr:hypothetical protein B4901_09445 [Yersinia frederiksenii]